MASHLRGGAVMMRLLSPLDRTRKGRRSPVWKLDASPAKPRPRLQNIHHDLDYDVNLEAVQRKTVFTNLDHGKVAQTHLCMRSVSLRRDECWLMK